MRSLVLPVLQDATERGRLPIVVDATSCTEGLIRLLHDDPSLTVIDAIAFVDTTVLPGLPPARRLPSLVVHPTCSSSQLGLNPSLLAIASAVAEEVITPDEWGCCGFAGDRGLLHPELTASATAAEAQEVRQRAPATAYASVNRTCELGLTIATGRPYRHLLEILDEVTRSPKTSLKGE